MKLDAKTERMTKAERERRIAAIELRRTAFHEASHYVVISRLRGLAQVDIWRNSRANVAQGEAAWRGRCLMMAPAGSLPVEIGGMSAAQIEQRRRFVLETIPADWNAIYGLAGLVGEAMAVDEAVDEDVVGHIQAAIECDEVSATDLEALGDWTEEQVFRTVDLLREQWPEVERVAADAMRQAQGRSSPDPRGK